MKLALDAAEMDRLITARDHYIAYLKARDRDCDCDWTNPTGQG
jgi:hypothetical protein